MSNSLQEIDDIIMFRRLIKLINKELKRKMIYDFEYMLISNSIDDVFSILEKESENYNFIKDEQLGSGIIFKGLLEEYFVCVKKYYDTLLIKEDKSDKVADKYYRKLKEPKKKATNIYNMEKIIFK